MTEDDFVELRRRVESLENSSLNKHTDETVVTRAAARLINREDFAQLVKDSVDNLNRSITKELSTFSKELTVHKQGLLDNLSMQAHQARWGRELDRWAEAAVRSILAEKIRGASVQVLIETQEKKK
jgi:signal transduction protein with GAF and PtsI domain